MSRTEWGGPVRVKKAIGGVDSVQTGKKQRILQPLMTFCYMKRRVRIEDIKIRVKLKLRDSVRWERHTPKEALLIKSLPAPITLCPSILFSL